MSLLLELGRFLFAGGVRTVGRGLVRIADAVDIPESLEKGLGVEDEEAPLVTPAAASMIAVPEVHEEPPAPPPPAGSLAARGRKVGQPWVR